MANFVQSLHLPATHLPAVKQAVTSPRTNHFFTSAFTSALTTAQLQDGSLGFGDRPSTDTGTSPGANIGRPDLLSIEIDQSLTGRSLADIVALVVTRPNALTRRFAEQIYGPVPDQPEPVVSDKTAGPAPSLVVEPKQSRDTTQSDGAELEESPAREDAPPVQVTADANDPKALRFRTSSPSEAAGLEIQGRRAFTQLPATAAADRADIEENHVSAGGELVFQLSLRTPEEFPFELGSAPPLNGELPSNVADALEQTHPRLTPMSIDEIGEPFEHWEQSEPSRAITSANHTAERWNQNALPEPSAPTMVGPSAPDTIVLPHASLAPPSQIRPAVSLERTSHRANVAQSAEVTASRPPAAPMLNRISVLVRGTDQFVRLDIHQKMGAVRVAVHSDDAALAARLCDSLPELLNRLDERGLQARVTSVATAQSNAVQSSQPESFGSEQYRDEWSQNQTRQEQRQRNPQRHRRSVAWELQEK